jgi:hypothetical protein
MIKVSGAGPAHAVGPTHWRNRSDGASDKLPLSIDYQFRTNLRPIALPNSPGDHWILLAYLLEQDASFRNDLLRELPQAKACERLEQKLSLVTPEQFPGKKVLALARHDAYRHLCDEFCSSGVGRELFQLQPFTDLKESRIEPVGFPPDSGVIRSN